MSCLKPHLIRRMEAYRNSMLHNKDAFRGKTVRVSNAVA